MISLSYSIGNAGLNSHMLSFKTPWLYNDKIWAQGSLFPTNPYQEVIVCNLFSTSFYTPILDTSQIEIYLIPSMARATLSQLGDGHSIELSVLCNQSSPEGITDIMPPWDKPTIVLPSPLVSSKYYPVSWTATPQSSPLRCVLLRIPAGQYLADEFGLRTQWDKVVPQCST
jgi:hypothetical protein